jgi:hypothetical protein
LTENLLDLTDSGDQLVAGQLMVWTSTGHHPVRGLILHTIKVDTATWSKAGQLDWWVKEPQQWLGRVRGKDGRQRWIRAVDLRPAKSE